MALQVLRPEFKSLTSGIRKFSTMPLSSLDIFACMFNPFFNPLHSGYRCSGTLANSEDPDDTLKVAFHPRLLWLLRYKQSLGKEIY